MLQISSAASSGNVTWATGLSLPVGQGVTYGAGLYRVRTAHTAGATFDAFKFDIIKPTSILEGVELLATGHSFVQGYYESVATVAATTWPYPAEIARRLGMNLTNWGGSGKRIGYVLAEMIDSQYGRTPVPVSKTGVVMVDIAKNDENSQSATCIASWKNVMRNITHFVRQGVRTDDTAGSVTLSGAGWAAKTGNPNGLFMLGTNFRRTTALTDYVEVAFTGTEVNLWIGAFDSATKTGGDVKITVDGVDTTTFSTVDLYKPTPPGDGVNLGYAPHCVAVRGLSSGAHTVRLTNMTSGAEFYYDHWGQPSSTPPLVVYVKEPASVSPSSLNESTVAAYNTAIDQLVTEFATGTVVSSDCSTAGGFDSATMLQTTSGIHPNAKGNQFMATQIIKTLTNAMQETYTTGIHIR
jgi:hypothetical protein